MAIRGIILFLLATISFVSHAQRHSNAFHLGWNALVPFSDKDFTGSTSTAGVRMGYTKFIDERFAFGLEVGYSTLDDYVPLTTFEFTGGAITTDIYNYLYYYTVMANGQYFFSQGNRFMPYTSLGMGVAFSEYKIFYNVYQESDNTIGFVVRPEVGTLFQVRERSGFGLKAAVGFDYATNKSDYFETKNLSGFNFQLGIVLLNR